MPQAPPRSRALTAYAVGVVLLAICAVAVAFVLPTGDVLGSPRLPALSLAALLVATQSQRLFLAHGKDDQLEITIASIFVMALVLTGPLWFLLTAQAVALTIEVLRSRRGAHRLLVDNAQLAISALIARLTYCTIAGRDLLHDDAPFRPQDIGAALAGGAALFLVHHALFGTHHALRHDEPVLPGVRRGLPVQVATSGMLLPFAPVVVVAMDFSVLLLPLLLIPISTVRRSAVLRADREGLALHDTLTGLPNRLMLLDQVRAGLAAAGRTGAVTGVLIIDLDHFKDINDTLGHYVGDRLLREVGDRLRESLRDGDTVARLGGDEFAVLACDLTGTDDAEHLARRMIETLQQPFTVDGVRLDVQASVGIAVSPEHGTDVVTLLQRADVALYDAKAHRGTYAVYEPERDLHSVEKLGFLGELREAVHGGQLVVHYQPKCDAITGQLVGLEALVRWQHPTRGLVFPDAFIEIAENTGLIRALTLEVLDQALSTARDLRDAGDPLAVAVNISVRCLADLELPSQVSALLARWDLPPDLLTLEVTETSIMVDPERSMLVLGELRDLGVTLSIDDFGTGYSSLSYLKRLEPHELKIDRSFVLAMATNSHDAVIVRSTVELGHSLGLRVVAEGVEDSVTWGLLRALGCDVIQGYHLSRPLPVSSLLPWLQAYRKPLGSVVPSNHDRDGRPAGHL